MPKENAPYRVEQVNEGLVSLEASLNQFAEEGYKVITVALEERDKLSVSWRWRVVLARKDG